MYSIPLQPVNEWRDSPVMYLRDDHRNELELQHWWENLVFPLSLNSLAGESILVVKGGELNDNAGPDFLNGVIMVDGEVKHGDIEIHTHESGWHDHGHCTDDRYSNVILHLITIPHRSGEVCRHKGYTPRHTANITALGGNRRRSADNQSPLCRTAPVAVDSSKILETLGWKRLVRKSQDISRGLDSSPVKTIWYIRMLRAMGYGQNVQQMMKIAEKIPFHRALELSYHLSEEQIIDFVSGLTGYAEDTRFETPLWDTLHRQLEIEGLAFADWRPMRSRPSNHPVIRLALLFRNLSHWYELLQLFSLDMSPGSFIRELSAKMSGYSRYRKFFPDVPFTLGKSRAIELVINVYIPLWLQLLKTDTAQDLHEWASNLPAIPLYDKLEQFIKSSRWKSLYTSAYMKPLQVQGLLWLQDNYCRRKFCAICPALSGFNG